MPIRRSLGDAGTGAQTTAPTAAELAALEAIRATAVALKAAESA